MTRELLDRPLARLRLYFGRPWLPGGMSWQQEQTVSRRRPKLSSGSLSPSLLDSSWSVVEEVRPLAAATTPFRTRQLRWRRFSRTCSTLRVHFRLTYVLFFSFFFLLWFLCAKRSPFFGKLIWFSAKKNWWPNVLLSKNSVHFQGIMQSIRSDFNKNWVFG